MKCPLCGRIDLGNHEPGWRGPQAHRYTHRSITMTDGDRHSIINGSLVAIPETIEEVLSCPTTTAPE